MKASLWLSGLMIAGGLLTAAPAGLSQAATATDTPTTTLPAASTPTPTLRASINWHLGASWTIADSASTATLPANFDHVYVTGETIDFPVASLHVPGFTIDENASTLDFGSGNVYTYAQVLALGYTDIDQAYQEFNGAVVPDGENYADSTALFTTVLVPEAASVTVNYVVAGTNTTLATTTLTSAFGYTVTLPARSFDGYTLAADQPTSYHITTPGENTVTIAYTPVTTPNPDPTPTPEPTPTPKPTPTPEPTTSAPTKAESTVVTTSAKQEKLPETGDQRQSGLTVLGLTVTLLASTLLWRRRKA